MYLIWYGITELTRISIPLWITTFSILFNKLIGTSVFLAWYQEVPQPNPMYKGHQGLPSESVILTSNSSRRTFKNFIGSISIDTSPNNSSWINPVKSTLPNQPSLHILLNTLPTANLYMSAAEPWITWFPACLFIALILNLLLSF